MIVLTQCGTLIPRPRGPTMQLTGEDSYQIAIMGVQGIRVEIVSDAPPPPDEPPCVLSLSPRLVADACVVHPRECLVRQVCIT